MFTLLLFVLMFLVFGRVLVLGLRLTWGIFKILLSVFLVPVIMIGLIFSGLMYAALILLVICGIVSLFIPKA